MSDSRFSLSRLRGHLSGRERAWFVVIALVFAGLWAFAELADAVLEKETRSFDEELLLALRTPGDPTDPIGPRWFEEVMRDLTALGGVTVVALITAAVGLYLLGRRKYRAVILLVASVAGAWGVNMILKASFGRARPSLVPHGSVVYSASFPSGHAMVATATYLILAVLLARLHTSMRLKIFVFTWAVLISVLVGVSRVYLGVHWPTDVLAGWTVGASWALLCWLVTAWLQRQGAVEPPAQSGEDGPPRPH